MSKQIVGYARANDPNDLPAYAAQLTEAGCSAVFTERIGGNTIDRPALNKALALLKSGDTLMVPSMDRLARDFTPLFALVEEIRGRGIKLVMLDAKDRDQVEELLSFRVSFEAVKKE